MFQVSKNLGKVFTPSVFQIRLAGYKGVLACDPTLVGRKASFRPSMRKFESPHRRLEVTHTSRPQVVYLNHQVIMLLSNLGVPDEEFLALQKEMLDRLAGKFGESASSREWFLYATNNGNCINAQLTEKKIRNEKSFSPISLKAFFMYGCCQLVSSTICLTHISDSPSTRVYKNNCSNYLPRINKGKNIDLSARFLTFWSSDQSDCVKFAKSKNVKRRSKKITPCSKPSAAFIN